MIRYIAKRRFNLVDAVVISTAADMVSDHRILGAAVVVVVGFCISAAVEVFDRHLQRDEVRA